MCTVSLMIRRVDTQGMALASIAEVSDRQTDAALDARRCRSPNNTSATVLSGTCSQPPYVYNMQLSF
jgi:hypothetical protein